MHTVKQDVRELLDNLPDDSTIEDIQYHLYVLEKFAVGATTSATADASLTNRPKNT